MPQRAYDVLNAFLVAVNDRLARGGDAGADVRSMAGAARGLLRGDGDATQAGQVGRDAVAEHSDRDQSGQGPQAGGGHRLPGPAGEPPRGGPAPGGAGLRPAVAGRQGVEEPDVSPEQEAALDRAWDKIVQGAADTFAADGLYHGPKPPGDAKDWKEAGTGPRGGKRWQWVDKGDAPKQGDTGGSKPAKGDFDWDGRGGDAGKWLHGWSWGTPGGGNDFTNPGLPPKPAMKELTKKGGLRPDEKITLYRAHLVGAPASEIESWTTEKGMAETLADPEMNEDAKLHPRVVLTRTGTFENVLAVVDRLPAALKDQGLPGEVLVVNGPGADALIDARGGKVTRPAQMPVYQTGGNQHSTFAADFPKPPDTGDVALAGADGRKAAELLHQAKLTGANTLTRLATDALGRLARGHSGQGGPVFTEDERRQLTESITACLATSNLLARTALNKRAARDAGLDETQTFADESPFESFAAAPVKLMAPQRALDYFSSLAPRLRRIDPRDYEEGMRRWAFTLAVKTERTLLENVKAALEESLATGTGKGPQKIAGLLEAAGLEPANPQYAEMVYRTNMMDAYTQGTMDEMKDLGDDFPVWRYDGIRDGRQGEDHEPHFGHYYPATKNFAEVRGDRPYNCRCCPTPIFRRKWAQLQQQGARLAA